MILIKSLDSIVWTLQKIGAEMKTEPDEVADFIAQKGYRVISAMKK